MRVLKAILVAKIVCLKEISSIKTPAWSPPFPYRRNYKLPTNKELEDLGMNPPRFENFTPISNHGDNNCNKDRIISDSEANFIQISLRVLYLFLLFLLPLVLSILAIISSLFRETVWYPLITKCITYSGPAFIKWGQWSSTRPDMFPESLCISLSKLHSNAPTHSFRFTKKSVEKLFNGQKIDKVFDWFDKTAVASGSIAQVHRAIFKGNLVAVKVRHPSVSEKMSMDFRIMKRVAKMADSAPGLKWLNLGQSMAQFGHTMSVQTRLDIEAQHLLIFNRNFCGRKEYSFPKVICYDESVLVETFEDGSLISSFVPNWESSRKSGKGTEQDQLSPEVAHFVVSSGQEMYLKMLMQDNLMHADLHPGNILLCTSSYDESDPRSVPRIVLVDAGMVANLTDYESKVFIGLLQSLGKADHKRAVEYMLQFSQNQVCEGEKKLALERDMESLFERCCGGYGTGVLVGDVFRGAMTLARKHKVRIDIGFATLMMNLLCLDGMAVALHPSYNLLDGARPMLEAYRTAERSGIFKGFILKVFVPLSQRIKRRRDGMDRRRLNRP